MQRVKDLTHFLHVKLLNSQKNYLMKMNKIGFLVKHNDEERAENLKKNNQEKAENLKRDID